MSGILKVFLALSFGSAWSIVSNRTSRHFMPQTELSNVLKQKKTLDEIVRYHCYIIENNLYNFVLTTFLSFFFQHYAQW
jgi:hypothetical protein